MKTKILLFALCCLNMWQVEAAVETLQVYSTSMQKEVACVVVTPDSYESSKAYPVVYLLHGFGGNHETWVKIEPSIDKWSSDNEVIIVCPYGKNSWYWDSPQDSSYRYETFVSQELVAHIDSTYPTLATRQGRAIAGLSMGGHGAMWLSMRHTDVYGAAGSTSGGVDIRPFPNNWEMAKQLGSLADNPDVWEAHTVINQIEKIENGDLALIIDCGYDDFFFEVNNTFHQKLLEHGIIHDYIVRAGEHNVAYWSNSIHYQLLFFKRYFDSETGK